MTENDDLLYRQAFEWDWSKSPPDPEFRAELAVFIHQIRRDIFRLPADRWRSQLVALREFHRKQMEDPQRIAAEKVMREIVCRMRRDWELWRKPPAGGVQ